MEGSWNCTFPVYGLIARPDKRAGWHSCERTMNSEAKPKFEMVSASLAWPHPAPNSLPERLLALLPDIPTAADWSAWRLSRGPAPRKDRARGQSAEPETRRLRVKAPGRGLRLRSSLARQEQVRWGSPLADVRCRL